MTKYIAVLTICIALLAGCSITVVVDEQFTATPSGKLSISEDWGVDPGKYTVSTWDGELHTFEFELYNDGDDACFRINGDDSSMTCVSGNSTDTIAFPVDKDTQFTVAKIVQGNVHHEVLVKIVER